MTLNDARNFLAERYFLPLIYVSVNALVLEFPPEFFGEIRATVELSN